MRRALRNFIIDRAGVAAVEAGLLIPVLALLFVGTMETSVLLDARRAVNDASYSLVSSVAGASALDAELRDTLTKAHAKIVDAAGLKDSRVVVRGYERLSDGSFEEIWSWSPVGSLPSLTASEISSKINNVIIDREGLVVTVVEANYTPIFEGLFPDFGGFQAFHMQTPTAISVPIFR